MDTTDLVVAQYVRTYIDHTPKLRDQLAAADPEAAGALFTRLHSQIRAQFGATTRAWRRTATKEATHAQSKNQPARA